ncbi:MAG: MFS transporter [Candidatus Rokubacteria bacterium]|nr:MFS transporter [Candidatus Rokubacteria bacterium]
MRDQESLANPRLGLAFATMLFVSGLANTFPIFFPPLLAEFGGSRAATASTVTLFWIGGATLGPLAGHLVDRWNPRLLVTLGLGAAALGFGVGALAPTRTVFILAVGLGGGVGAGLTGMVTQAALIADAYVRRRGLATGIAFSGSMAAYVLATPAQWAIDTVGWRGTFGGWVAAIALLIPLAWWICPARLGARASLAGGVAAPSQGVGDIVRAAPFWLLTLVFTIPPLVGYLATVQHALYFHSLGFAAQEAAAMLVVGGVLSASGRALAGLAADRVGAPAAGLVSYSLSLVGTLCLVGLEFAPGRALAYAYVLFVFLPLGSRATIVSVLVGRVAPPALYGTVFGLLAIGNNLGAAAGPVLSGALFDLTRSYLVIYLVAAALLALGIAALVAFTRLTRPRPSA